MTGQRAPAHLAAFVVALIGIGGAPAAARAQFPPEVRGRVIDGGTGAGIGGADVILGTGERTTTAADGGFVLRALAPGVVEVLARRVGYTPARTTVTLANGRVTTVALTLHPAPWSLPDLVREAERAPDAGTTVLNRERLERSGARELGEALANETGLVVTRRGGPGAPTTVSIRGSGAAEVLVLVDGVPLNEPLTGEADLSTVSLANVERVTVLRGAHAVQYGRQALAGVILVETRRPGTAELEGTVGGGRWGERLLAARIAGGASPSRGGLGASLTGEWRRVAGEYPFDVPVERGGGVARRANADAERVLLAGTVGWEGPPTGVRLRGELFDADRGMPGSVVQPTPHARQHQRRAGVGGDVRTMLGGWELTAQATVQRQTARFQDSLPPVAAPYDDRAAVTSLVSTARLAGALGPVELAGGGELRRLGIEATSLDPAAPDAMWYGGGWLHARHRLTPHGAWRVDLAAAARIDASSLAEGAVLSPRVQLGAQRGRFAVQLAWGRAYNPPSLADLFFQEGVQVQPNPALEPERIRGELTAALEWRDQPVGPLRLEATATLFRADIDGMILWSPDFRYVWRPDNFDVRRRGGELAARLGDERGRATLTGALTYTDVTYTGPVLHGQVIYRPRWTANTTLAATLLGIDADVAWRYTGPRRTGIGSDLNQLPAFGVVDLRFAKRFALGGTAWRLRAGIEDVFDRRPAMLIDFPSPGRTWVVDLTVSRRGFPQPLTTNP